MKIGLMIITLLSMLLMAYIVEDKTFCDGWKDGYINGYCYKDYDCETPNVPVCPNSRAGEDTYSDGYNMGFEKGREKSDE